MFEGIIARIRRRKIGLRIDQSLQSQIATSYRSNSQIDFSFSLFDLINAIGTCRTVAATKANKFAVALDFLEVLPASVADELRISINSDGNIEQNQDISRYVGEGLSIVIAEKLYSLQKSTITRIKRRGSESRPDFVGYTSVPNYQNRLKIVWEAKGSTDEIEPNEIAHAKYQKQKEPADIAFVSLASLKSTSMTEVSIEDPPTLPLEGEELNRQLSRIMHYVNVFNFIGQSSLGRYFRLLGERLEKDRQFPEFDEKIRLFDEIKSTSIRLAMNEKHYLGTIERIGDSSFFYVGFDERLLSVFDFVNFVDYDEDFTFVQHRNTFTITRDGICYGYLQDLGGLRDLDFKEEINLQEIPFYRDTLSIRDLDHLLDFQLTQHVKYLFAREGFGIGEEALEGEKRYDLIVSKKGKKYAVEVKKNIIIKAFEHIKDHPGVDACFLVTTTIISDEDIRYARDLNVIVIDRRYLKAIIRKRKSISGRLSGLST